MGCIETISERVVVVDHVVGEFGRWRVLLREFWAMVVDSAYGACVCRSELSTPLRHLSRILGRISVSVELLNFIFLWMFMVEMEMGVWLGS